MELQVKIGSRWEDLGNNWPNKIKSNARPGYVVEGMGVGPCFHGYLYRTKAKAKASTASDPGDWSGWIYSKPKQIHCLG